jgi:hypothetical protein
MLATQPVTLVSVCGLYILAAPRPPRPPLRSPPELPSGLPSQANKEIGHQKYETLFHINSLQRCGTPKPVRLSFSDYKRHAGSLESMKSLEITMTYLLKRQDEFQKKNENVVLQYRTSVLLSRTFST